MKALFGALFILLVTAVVAFSQTEADRNAFTVIRKDPPNGIPVRIIDEPMRNQESEDRERADLLAQQSMAESTRSIVNLTYAQIVLGALGTVALSYTLFLNWKSTNAAVGVLKAERAWMVYSGFNYITALNVHTDNGVVKDGCMIEIVWTNGGRTPAINVECVIEHRIVDANSDFVPIFELADRPDDPDFATVGASAAVTSSPRLLNDEESSSFRLGKTKIIVYSLVTYNDIFDNKTTRRSEACMSMTCNGEEKTQDGMYRGRVTSRPVGKQNGVR